MNSRLTPLLCLAVLALTAAAVIALAGCRSTSTPAPVHTLPTHTSPLASIPGIIGPSQ